MKEIIIKVDGMMCSGCENRIKNTLEEIEGVQIVIANHESGKVTVTANEVVEEAVLKETLEDIGFEVIA